MQIPPQSFSLSTENYSEHLAYYAELNRWLEQTEAEIRRLRETAPEHYQETIQRISQSLSEARGRQQELDRMLAKLEEAEGITREL